MTFHYGSGRFAALDTTDEKKILGKVNLGAARRWTHSPRCVHKGGENVSAALSRLPAPPYLAWAFVRSLTLRTQYGRYDESRIYQAGALWGRPACTDRHSWGHPAVYQVEPRTVRALHTDQVQSYIERYAELRTLLPAHGIIGYVSDDAATPPLNRDRFYMTQYALAPLIVVQDSNQALIICNVEDSTDASRVCQRPGLVLVRDLGNGLALLRKVQE